MTTFIGSTDYLVLFLHKFLQCHIHDPRNDAFMRDQSAFKIGHVGVCSS